MSTWGTGVRVRSPAPGRSRHGPRPHARHPRSLRTFLLGRLLVWLLPIVAAGVALHWQFERRLLTGAFDAQALERAQALASLVVLEQGARTIDAVIEYMPGYTAGSAAHYFQAWGADGAELARSLSLKAADLPRRRRCR